ncbi:DUF2200 family protein [Nocardioides convexus]|uniref:DUF2200 family protein n=1 Tax=Nocardioides convexus TaxID=2712224 RepID=UPI0024188A33|nr:DUF2200 family protein [Nocardioides convexus]
MHRIFTTSVASVYPHYVTKVERKGRTQAESGRGHLLAHRLLRGRAWPRTWPTRRPSSTSSPLPR